ncbi:unnamed protein product [Pleuronectes platessa]|uniref:Uncharacterized protein n=1 Tax=Pleuronectes platessa TaxID=8262 RepID=A0A9N7VUQ7_PLEPL|nr:unnamed protein product [Pleuronectes platessa]
MSPIVPGRVRQASSSNRPCLLQQLWTSPHLPAALLLLLLQLLPPWLHAPLLLLLNINPAAAGSGRKEEARGVVFEKRPNQQRTKELNRERISDSQAELTGLLHSAIRWPRKKTGSELRGLSLDHVGSESWTSS